MEKQQVMVTAKITIDFIYFNYQDPNFNGFKMKKQAD